jgi:glycosyltransferase involved in cell wall biosynthesis
MVNILSPATIEILIIIPCYNEELRLKTESFLQFSNNNSNVHFLFVDDGSKDLTVDILKDLCHKIKNANFLVLNKNVGKGEAIRSGVLASEKNLMKFDFVGYIDADLSVPLEEINDFSLIIQKNKKIKFILGARISRLGASINRSTIRHYLGRVFATVVSIMLNDPLYDSQCGAKLIQSSIIIEIFKEKFISKWLFDVELLIRWKVISPNYINMTYEHPLSNWTEVHGSKLKLKNFLYAPIELFLIWKNYHKSMKNALQTKPKLHKNAV